MWRQSSEIKAPRITQLFVFFQQHFESFWTILILEHLTATQEAFTRARANVVYAETKMNKASRFICFALLYWMKKKTFFCEAVFCFSYLYFFLSLIFMPLWNHWFGPESSYQLMVRLNWFSNRCDLNSPLVFIWESCKSDKPTPNWSVQLYSTIVLKFLLDSNFSKASSRSHAIFQLRISKRERVFEAAKTGQKVELHHRQVSDLRAWHEQMLQTSFWVK